MYLHLYSLNESRLRHYIDGVRKIVSGEQPERWPFLYREIESFRPKPLLGSSGGPLPPYTQVSYHTSPALGWEDFSVDEVPSPEDPRLAWILRLLVLETSEHLLEGKDARFSAVFCDWLPSQGLIKGEAEQREFELFRDRMFYSQEPVPKDLAFLESDAHRAYLTPGDVALFVDTERDARLLHSVAERVASDTYGDYGSIVALELRRMQRFFELVNVEGHAVYYHEHQT